MLALDDKLGSDKRGGHRLREFGCDLNFNEFKEFKQKKTMFLFALVTTSYLHGISQ
jgi:hypothetical protein